MMKYSVDRIEDGLVTLEDEYGKNITVELSLFPSDIKEGTVVCEENGVYLINEEATAISKNDIATLRKKMLNKFAKE